MSVITCYLSSHFIEVQAFVLNFNGRVDKASVKNFQLIDEFDDNRIHMQFGRIGKQNFNMDVAFPFSIF
jgi:tubby and related proteins